MGCASTAWAASIAGTGGIEVRPAPSRALRSRLDDVPRRRVTLLPDAPARAVPSAVEASRLEAWVTVDGVWAMLAGIVGTESEAVCAGVAAGDPQTSQ
jgi:hypothetical protein